MSFNVETIWQQTLEMMERQMHRTSFETWLKDTKPVIRYENVIVVEVPQEFFANWLRKNYLTNLKSCLKELCSEDLEIEFVETAQREDYLNAINQQPLNAKQQMAISPKRNIKAVTKSTPFTFIPKYVFNTFVIGESNRFAHAAALAVAETPAKSYNPLFLYGGSGLGKTHLMHAIGHYVQENHPQLSIIYISSEKFINEFIDATQHNTTSEFRSKYRSTDILMIDDIQFLENKERTQVEFFHTFNELYNAKKQLIISSDRPPREIKQLEERLRSRFEWGLQTDIQPPGFETRVAILRKKCEMEDFKIPDDINFYLAEHIKSNIRELEGALTRINAYASITKQAITLDLVQEVLKDILPQTQYRPLTISYIQEIVADYFNITKDTLISRRRTKAIVVPRQIAMFLSRALTDASLPKIGEEFGGRDHTTVMHALEKVSNEFDTDKKIKYIVTELKKRIQNT